MTLPPFETKVDEDRSVVSASGDLDLSSAPALERAIERAIDGDNDTLTLDLRGLRFIDSTGLRLVLTTDARLRERGGHLSVVRGPEVVHRVFELAVLEDRLTFVDGRDIGDGSTDGEKPT
ncbi:MAG: STAS domain-containing protein [Actinomycetota bacterium]